MGLFFLPLQQALKQQNSVFVSFLFFLPF